MQRVAHGDIDIRKCEVGDRFDRSCPLTCISAPICAHPLEKAVVMALRRVVPLGLLLGFAAGCTAVIDGAKGEAASSSPGFGSTTMSGAGATAGSNAQTARDPGRVTLHRLNQTEYDNTVHDLLGTSSQPARSFLGDTQANGFDNNGDLLSLSSVRIDQYRQAAETLANEALQPPLRAKGAAKAQAAGATPEQLL
jgi:hypothetical protein